MLKTTALLFFLLILSCCTNLFSTREDKVEKPDPGTVSQVFEDPSDPDKIFTNLSRSIEGANTVEYGKLFSNLPERAFRFIGDPSQANKLIPPWTYENERNYFINLVTPENNITPAFRFSFLDSIPAKVYTALDSVETGFMEYELKVILRDSEEIFVGFSNFKLFKSSTANDAWYIYHWEDRAKNDLYDRSWSALKADYQ